MASMRHTLRLYWKFTQAHKKWVISILLLLPTVILLESTILPLLIASALNKLSTNPGTFRDYQTIIGAILLIELYAVVIWRLLFRWVWHLEAAVMKRMADSVYDHLLAQSTDFHNSRFGGALVSQANKFVAAYERLVDTLAFTVIPLVLNYVFVLVVLAIKVPWYALVLVLATILFAVVMIRYKIKEQPYITAEAKAETAATAQLADGITNFFTVKSFANEQMEAKLYHLATQYRQKRSLLSSNLVFKNELLLAGVSRSLSVLAIAASVIAVLEFHLALGILFLVVSYTTGLLRRLWDLSGIFKNLNRVAADAHDMTEILANTPEVADLDRPIPADITRGDIQLVNVTYRYPDSAHAPLFEGLNLHIKPGEKVGLVGPSGGGKSTLTRLILRLMDVSGGEILIDDKNIAHMRQTDLRSHIAYVPQEPLMFHRTINDNIRYGRINATQEEVQATAKLAHAAEFIEKLPNRYASLVGERGTKLSGGQRQRIAIARAMLKHAPILILDEATSALDSESERLIQDALKQLMKKRTAIVVAHRLSTIQKMDRIIVLEHGKIIEQGTHKELLAKGGMYADLWAHQTGGFIE